MIPLNLHITSLGSDWALLTWDRFDCSASSNPRRASIKCPNFLYQVVYKKLTNQSGDLDFENLGKLKKKLFFAFNKYVIFIIMYVLLLLSLLIIIILIFVSIDRFRNGVQPRSIIIWSFAMGKCDGKLDSFGWFGTGQQLFRHGSIDCPGWLDDERMEYGSSFANSWPK